MSQVSNSKLAQMLQGFTLIEMLVALVILSAMVVTFLNVVSHVSRQSNKAQKRFEAYQSADQYLNRLTIDLPATIGDQSGEWPHGLRWQTQISSDSDAPSSTGPFQLVSVTLEVAWGKELGDKIRFQSLKLVAR